METGRWEHFQHGADIGVRGLGPSLDVAFEQAALALTGVICDPARVGGAVAVELELDAPDPEFLLFQWLNELVYQMATRRLLFGRFRVRIEGGQLRATAWGEPVHPARHQPAVEVKGATLTELRVYATDDGGWGAQCVVDV